MTGEERKRFIIGISKRHAEMRADWLAAEVGSYNKAYAFGYMHGLERAADQAGGLETLSGDLSELRDMECRYA